MPSTPQNIADFFLRCQRHDWTYVMSDDSNVYRRGAAADNSLRIDAKKSPKTEQMFADFYKHVWHQGPQPKLEDYVDAKGQNSTSEADPYGANDPRPVGPLET